MKFKYFLFSALLITSMISVKGQTHYAEWVAVLESNGEITRFNNVLGHDDHVLVNGSYSGSASFLGVQLEESTGINGVVTKITNNLEVVWATTITGSNITSFYDMKVDSDNNIILAGWTSTIDTLKVNGVPVLPNNGMWINHAIIMKLNAADGSLIWFKGIPSQEYGTLNASRLTVDENNIIYVTGYYSHPFTFEGIDFPYVHEYGDNLFIIKFDTDGVVEWGQYLTAASNGGWAQIRAVESSSNALYFSLEYYSPYLVNGEPLPYTGEYYWNALLKASTETGDFTGVKAFGSLGGQSINDICVDGDGNLLTAGFFTSETQLVIDDITLSGNGYDEGFILKTDADLNTLWAKPMGGGYADRAFNVNIDQYNNIYIGGGFDCYTDFSYDGEVVLNAADPNSLSNFLVVTDKDGNFLQSAGLYGDSQESVLNMGSFAVVGGENVVEVFCAGTFSGGVEFVEGELAFTDHNRGVVYKWVLPMLVSAENMDTASDYGTFPNPCNDFVKIYGLSGNTEVVIYDLKGIVVSKQHVDRIGLVRTGDLKTGTYLIRLSDKNTVQSFKVVKN